MLPRLLRTVLHVVRGTILPNKHYKNIFSEKLVNDLHAWIENHPHVIHYSNVKDSLFIKINGTLVKKQNHVIHISVRELHNDMILTISEGFVLVQEQFMEKYVL